MGCDIHLYLEQKIDGEWTCIDDFRTRMTWEWKDGRHVRVWGSRPARMRNYGRFAALAGVRGSGPEPQGWPEDASRLARYRSGEYGQDGHSHSWCTLENALLVFEGTMGEPPPDGMDPLYYFFDLDVDDVETVGLSNFRLLFFFDN